MFFLFPYFFFFFSFPPPSLKQLQVGKRSRSFKNSEAESLSRQASPSATVIQYGALVCRLGYPPSAVRLVALARWRHARIRLLSKAGSSREAQGPNAKEVFSNLGEQFQELATGRTLDKVWLSFLGADRIVEVRAGDLGGFWWDSSEKVEREEGGRE